MFIHVCTQNDRDTVMALLALIDPHSTGLWKRYRLERRVYRSKVGTTSYNVLSSITRVLFLLYTRDQTLFGTVMAMIN